MQDQWHAAYTRVHPPAVRRCRPVDAPDFAWLRWLNSSGFRSRKGAHRCPFRCRKEVCALASRSPQTQLKRAREQALKERRERKQAKKDARAAERRARADGEVSHSEADAG